MVQHGKKIFKMSRKPAHRDATLANMAAALFLNEKIRTTSPKARALKPYVDRLITKAKDESLHSRRLVASYMPHKEALKKLFQELVPKLQERNSGYSRVIKAGTRRGDAAEVAIIELIFDGTTSTSPKKSKKRRSRKTSKTEKGKGAAKAKKSVQAPVDEEEQISSEEVEEEAKASEKEAAEEAGEEDTDASAEGEGNGEEESSEQEEKK